MMCPILLLIFSEKILSLLSSSEDIDPPSAFYTKRNAIFPTDFFTVTVLVGLFVVYDGRSTAGFCLCSDLCRKGEVGIGADRYGDGCVLYFVSVTRGIYL